MSEQYNLKNVALIGRTFEEYYRMFNLGDIILNSQYMLDMGAGVSSFCAQANEKGARVTAADTIYGFEPDDIEAKSEKDLEYIVSNVPTDKFKWDYYKDIMDLKKYRERACAGFLDDYKQNRKKYIKTELPNTFFTDKEFTMTLVSHLLFLYDKQLDYNFHRNAIEELIRITSEEIRIYPLVNLEWKKSDFVERLMGDMAFGKSDFKIKKVNFEFVKGADEMLIVRP